MAPLAHLEVLEAVIAQSLAAVAVLVLLVKGMLAALIQTQVLSIVLAVEVVLVLSGLMLAQGRLVLAAQVFVQPFQGSVFFMLAVVVVQLNIGLVEAVRLVVGCSL